MIHQRNLSRLSNRLLREAGGRRIPEAVVERDYCLSWFLVGLAQVPLGDVLCFKGGTAIKKCFVREYRFSEDLVFTRLREKVSAPEIRAGLEPVFTVVKAQSGVSFNFAGEEEVKQNTYTFYLTYEGPLPSGGGKQVKTDVTLAEHIVFDLQRRPVLRVYPEYEDLPEGAHVQVYALEEIAVEKVLAVTDRARNEPRDVYDLWFLLTEGGVEVEVLPGAVRQKLAWREKAVPDIQEVLRAKEARYQRAWEERLAHQMAVLPGFEGVYRALRRILRRASWT
jgi:predicted nucleotidyltransferase component of viral defense system